MSIRQTDIKLNEYAAKMRASTELDNLPRYSEYSHWAPDRKNHEAATFGFDYYRTKFIVGGKLFEGLINIANSENRRVFYDLTNVKEIPGTSGKYAAPLARSSSASGNLFDENVSESGEEVKKNLKQSAGEDRRMEAESALTTETQEMIENTMGVLESEGAASVQIGDTVYHARLQERMGNLVAAVQESGKPVITSEAMQDTPENRKKLISWAEERIRNAEVGIWNRETDSHDQSADWSRNDRTPLSLRTSDRRHWCGNPRPLASLCKGGCQPSADWRVVKG